MVSSIGINKLIDGYVGESCNKNSEADTDHLEGVRWMLVSTQQKVFERWIEEHKGVILKVSRVHAANSLDQEDLFQDIAFQVWRSIPSYRGKAKVSTWIYRVALNTAMVWNRSQKKHRCSREPLYSVNEPHDPETSPTEFLEMREELDWLYKEIRKLPTADRSLTLLYLDAKSYHEIGEILGMSTNHVGVKLNRLKKHLRDASQRRDR